MKRILALLLVTTMPWGAASLVPAQTDAQAEKAKMVEKKVKSYAGEATMMPAPEVQMSRLTKGLQLTEEQQKQIRPLLDEEFVQLKKIQQNENVSPKQIQKQVEALRTETNAKMHTYLTPEQREKHDLVSKEIKANKQRRIKANRKARIGTKAEPPPPVSK